MPACHPEYSGRVRVLPAPRTRGSSPPSLRQLRGLFLWHFLSTYYKVNWIKVSTSAILQIRRTCARRAGFLSKIQEEDDWQLSLMFYIY